MKKQEILKQAKKICKSIDRQYDKLSIDKNDLVFNRYHDDMMYQSEGAWSEFNEIESYLNADDLTQDEADAYIKNLNDTLDFCKAVIKTQEASVKIPSTVFG